MMDNKPILPMEGYVFEHLHSGIRFHGGQMCATQNRHYCKIATPYVALVILLTGRIHFCIDQQNYHFSAGNNGRLLMIAVDKVCLFRRYIQSAEAFCKITIAGLEKWLDSRDTALYAEAVRSWTLTENLKTLAQQLLHARGDLLAKDTIAMQMLNHCWQHHIQAIGKQKHAPYPADAHRQKWEAKLQQAFNHGANNVEQLANALCISSRTLQRKIQQYCHCSAQQWLQKTCMNKALHFLGEDHLSIGEAAYLCGYQHPSSFIHAFRRYFGITPGALLHRQHD